MIRVNASRLRAGIAELFAAGGMDADKAAIVAEALVEADLIGHATHGSGWSKAISTPWPAANSTAAAATTSSPTAAPA